MASRSVIVLSVALLATPSLGARLNTTVKAGSKRICLSSELYTRTTTQATNASDDVGMTSWAEEPNAAGTCVTGIGGGKGLAEFKLCGPATLELSTGMNCDSPDETVVHGANTS